LVHLQICCHSYRPVCGLSTCFDLHEDVPIGGTVGGSIGRMAGGVIGQIAGAQIGSMSRVLEHIACISPLTHRQTHPAPAFVGIASSRSVNGNKDRALNRNSAQAAERLTKKRPHWSAGTQSSGAKRICKAAIFFTALRMYQNPRPVERWFAFWKYGGSFTPSK
jgi:hypothetical protein